MEGRGAAGGEASNPMTAFSEILYEVRDRVCTITLNRPARLNAVTSAMIRELVAAFDQADADDDVRAVIVTGAGRAYCAGADLSSGGDTFDGPARGREARPEEHRDGGGLVSLRIYDLKKPVIAAINGPAVGFGITMTLAMDIRLASTAARMGFVFARRGVVPEACSTWFLPRLVGISKASEWVCTGRVFSADEAREAGLVSRVLAPEALLTAAHDVAREIADNTSAISVALARQMLWKMLGAGHPMAAHRIDSQGMAWTGRSADAYEGVTSFLEKRPPKFTGRPSTDMPPFYPWWTREEFR
jgi:enoyl-CoA hydratase/carnithine racemase